MKLLHRPLLRRPRPDERVAVPTACTVHARCDRHSEAKVRALCVIAFAGSGARMRSLHVVEPGEPGDPGDSVTVLLRVTFAMDGPDTVALERLVTELSREPGVRDLHWRIHAAGDPLAEQ
ncbi:hypothetical protein [Streptomyces sp. UNOC14_S4]|uniref:hypothetical protein n=1 Tax=Streptomyces sp. UNOC14_S4 TaxID=2872340 RepID=UPI001E5B474F|nr:hypothetical protein [Streptomyces sp. UNOC14_S4]MCC3771526.1 hypothetical protein [Streptomyces sp. UNOC14_S4]